MKSIFILFITIFSVGLIAQEKTSDAVFEKIVKEYTLNADGSTEFHYYKKLKLNTHYSFNRLYGETFIVYNPAYQTLKINKSQTTQMDGNVVKAPENSFNEVLPRFARNVPNHNGLRELVVTHTGLEVGAVIELDYSVKSKAGFMKGLMADEVLTESSPVMQKQIIINVPKGKELNFKVINLRTGPKITETGKTTTYTFNFSGLKEDSHEGHQPGDKTHQPRMFFSTLTFAGAISEITNQNAFDYKLNEEMKDVVKETKDKCSSDLELVLKLQKIVAEEMNSWYVPPVYSGYNIRTGIETWNSNGGTPCEKTLLLAGLLREAGVHAKPVMVVPSKLYNEKIGCLPLAENILLQVSPRDRELMYISALKSADQNLVFSLNNKTILLFEPTKQYVESLNEKFENKVITNGSFVIGDDFKIAGNIETSLTEATNPYYKIKFDSSYLKSVIGGISKKEILSCEVINSAQYRSLGKLVIESKNPFKSQGDYFFWEIPVNKKGTESWQISYLNSERFTPYVVPFPINEQYSYTITLPSKTNLVNPIELKELKTDFGELVLSTSVEGNKVTVKRMLVINRPVISTAEYPAFKEMMDLWNEKNFRTLILKNQ